MVKTYVLHVAWAKAALMREQGRCEDAVRALRAAEPYDAFCEVDLRAHGREGGTAARVRGGWAVGRKRTRR
jgi:hypothetical protein